VQRTKNTVVTSTVPVTSGKLRASTPSKTSFPTPGRLNTISANTAPDSSRPTPTPSNATVGSTASFSA